MRIRTNAVGYMASVVVASSLLTLVVLQIVSAYSIPNHAIGDIVYVWVVMAFWVLTITALPALALIYFAERRSWRSAILYLIAGALLALPVGFWFDVQIMLECVAVGAVAGLTYWLVAGRRAGLRNEAAA